MSARKATAKLPIASAVLQGRSKSTWAQPRALHAAQGSTRRHDPQGAPPALLAGPTWTTIRALRVCSAQRATTRQGWRHRARHVAGARPISMEMRRRRVWTAKSDSMPQRQLLSALTVRLATTTTTKIHRQHATVTSHAALQAHTRSKGQRSVRAASQARPIWMATLHLHVRDVRWGGPRQSSRHHAMHVQQDKLISISVPTPHAHRVLPGDSAGQSRRRALGAVQASTWRVRGATRHPTASSVQLASTDRRRAVTQRRTASTASLGSTWTRLGTIKYRTALCVQRDPTVTESEVPS